MVVDQFLRVLRLIKKKKPLLTVACLSKVGGGLLSGEGGLAASHEALQREFFIDNLLVRIH